MRVSCIRQFDGSLNVAAARNLQKKFQLENSWKKMKKKKIKEAWKAEQAAEAATSSCMP